MSEIVLILDNIRSAYNVGAITRTAECLGIDKIHATGYTPHTSGSQNTPPFVIDKMKKLIHKTALGAENDLPIIYQDDISYLISNLKNAGYKIVALEQNIRSVSIINFPKPEKIALILGEEVHGIKMNILEICDHILEIPMLGKKESYNVSVAAGIALYELQRNELTEQ